MLKNDDSFVAIVLFLSHLGICTSDNSVFEKFWSVYQEFAVIEVI